MIILSKEKKATFKLYCEQCGNYKTVTLSKREIEDINNGGRYFCNCGCELDVDPVVVGDDVLLEDVIENISEYNGKYYNKNSGIEIYLNNSERLHYEEIK